MAKKITSVIKCYYSTKKITKFSGKVLFDRIRDVDPNDSDAVKEVLSSFFYSLSNCTEAHGNKWLQTLENVINR